MQAFEKKMRSASFVVTTELTPPKGIDLSEFFAKADALKGCIDAVNITESPRARMAVEPKSPAGPRHRGHRADHGARPQSHCHSG
jgi:methylenetetrahydrofolate reductase (NADPH)